MIFGVLIRIVTAFGVGERLQRKAALGLGVVAAVAIGLALWGGYTLWLSNHDRHVVTADRAMSNADMRNTQIGAERQAGADKATRDDQFATNQTEVKEATDAAAQNGNSPLDSLFNRLR